MIKWCLLILLYSLIPSASFSQTLQTNNCNDTTEYKIIKDGNYVKLAINDKGNWKIYDLFDSFVETFSYKCNRVDFDSIGSNELVINWRNGIYGSGAGTETGGIQIWDLDSANRVFNEITFCADINSSRNGNSAWYVWCEKDVKISLKKIVIEKKICTTEWNTSGKMVDPSLNCAMTDKLGVYVLCEGKIKKLMPTKPKSKRAESATFENATIKKTP